MSGHHGARSGRSISVVIPTYNRAPLLAETIGRVMSQTRPADEVVVIDDGSTDDTCDVLAGYGTRLTVIRIDNSGELVARNTGLAAARSALVAFCDSDDLWEPDFLAAMTAFWEDGAAEPLCAYADFREVRDGAWSAHSKFGAAPPGYWSGLQAIDAERALFRTPLVRALLTFQPFFPSCMMVDRARFLALGGWDTGVTGLVGCDFATTLRIAEHPPIGVLRRPLVRVRKHAGNFSGDVQRMNLGDAAVLAHVLATRASLAPYAAEIRRSIAARRAAAFDTAFARGDFAAADGVARLLDAPPRALRYRVKRAVLRLPPALRGPTWRMLTQGRAAT